MFWTAPSGLDRRNRFLFLKWRKSTRLVATRWASTPPGPSPCLFHPQGLETRVPPEVRALGYEHSHPRFRGLFQGHLRQGLFQIYNRTTFLPCFLPPFLSSFSFLFSFLPLSLLSFSFSPSLCLFFFFSGWSGRGSGLKAKTKTPKPLLNIHKIANSPNLRFCQFI